MRQWDSNPEIGFGAYSQSEALQNPDELFNNMHGPELVHDIRRDAMQLMESVGLLDGGLKTSEFAYFGDGVFIEVDDEGNDIGYNLESRQDTVYFVGYAFLDGMVSPTVHIVRNEFMHVDSDENIGMVVTHFEIDSENDPDYNLRMALLIDRRNVQHPTDLLPFQASEEIETDPMDYPVEYLVMTKRNGDIVTGQNKYAYYIPVDDDEVELFWDIVEQHQDRDLLHDGILFARQTLQMLSTETPTNINGKRLLD